MDWNIWGGGGNSKRFHFSLFLEISSDPFLMFPEAVLGLIRQFSVHLLLLFLPPTAIHCSQPITNSFGFFTSHEQARNVGYVNSDLESFFFS